MAVPYGVEMAGTIFGIQTVNILLADDSLIVRDRLRTLLQGLPHVFIVGEADNHPEAIHLTQTLTPDVIILDFEMTGMNGLESLKAIKQVPRPPLVIMLTNFGSEAYRVTCLEAGADFFFDKSYEFTNVKDLLAEMKFTLPS